MRVTLFRRHLKHEELHSRPIIDGPAQVFAAGGERQVLVIIGSRPDKRTMAMAAVKVVGSRLLFRRSGREQEGAQPTVIAGEGEAAGFTV